MWFAYSVLICGTFSFHVLCFSIACGASCACGVRSNGAGLGHVSCLAITASASFACTIISFCASAELKSLSQDASLAICAFCVFCDGTGRRCELGALTIGAASSTCFASPIRLGRLAVSLACLVLCFTCWASHTIVAHSIRRGISWSFQVLIPFSTAYGMRTIYGISCVIAGLFQVCRIGLSRAKCAYALVQIRPSSVVAPVGFKKAL
jgi:hypothetical protein